jgi:hypothetical protein
MIVESAGHRVDGKAWHDAFNSEYLSCGGEFSGSAIIFCVFGKGENTMYMFLFDCVRRDL